MRLVAWNVRAGAGTRLARVCAALDRWGPDVVVLSEYRATAPSLELAEWLAARGLHHQHTTASTRDPARNALLVASRYASVRVRGPKVSDPQRLLCVKLAEPPRARERSGDAPHTLRLAAVHVPNRVTGRKYDFLDAVVRHARRLGRHPAGIVVGDTNSGCRDIDEESSAFNAREEHWFSELERAGLADVYRKRHGARRAYTWYSPNGRNGFRLDQLFATPDLLERMQAIEYLWGEGHHEAGVSDHAAIVADLNWP